MNLYDLWLVISVYYMFPFIVVCVNMYYHGLAVAAAWGGVWYASILVISHYFRTTPNALFVPILVVSLAFSILGSILHWILQKRRLELKAYRGKYPAEALPSNDYYINKGVKHVAWGFVFLASYPWASLPSNPVVVYKITSYFSRYSGYNIKNLAARIDILVVTIGLVALGFFMDTIIKDERNQIDDAIKDFRKEKESKK